MKTATLTVAAIYINCPECGEAVPADNGSEMLEEIDREKIANVYACACGCVFRVPKWPKQRRTP